MDNKSEFETKPAVRSTKEQSLSPFDDLRSHIQDLEQRFENLFSMGLLKTPKFSWPEWSGFESLKVESPKVDIIDQKTSLLVRAELPGMKKENIDISVSDTSVTLTGESKEEQKEEKDNYYRREISSKSFSRTLSLPCEVQSKDAKASFENGVLQITLPKAEKAKAQSLKIE